MDTGLDQNEAELGVLILAVSLEMLADSNGLCSEVSIGQKGRLDPYMQVCAGTYLLDQHVQILRKLRCEACMCHSVSLNRTEAVWDMMSP